MTETRTGDESALTALLRDEMGHVHHLDRITLASVALLALPSLALLAAHMAGVLSATSRGEQAALATVALALAAGGNHILVVQAANYWVSFTVVGQLIRALGLVERGAFPASLLASPPDSFPAFFQRLAFGYRGPLFIIYSALTWLASFIILHYWLTSSWAFALAFLPLLILGASSLYVNYNYTRNLMASLRHEVRLRSAQYGTPKEQLAELHCNMADSLLRLTPPRPSESLRHYQIALELDPTNARAKMGSDLLQRWGGPYPP